MNNIQKGYKQTEVGVIPEEWNNDSIVNLASITTGNKNTQDRIEDGAYPFFVRSSTVERINSYNFDGEAVLTAGDGVGTGKVFHYINGKFDYHQRVYKISEFCERLDGYYFYLYFSNNFYQRIMQMTAKSSVDSIRREMIANMRIPLPPPDEQRAIAAALSDMDALLAKIDQLIAKKRDLKLATMQQLLTGKIRLPGFGPPVGAGSKPAQPKPAQMSDDTTVGAGSKPALSKPALSKPAQSKPAPNHPGASTMTGLARAGLEPAPTVPDGWEVKRLGNISEIDPENLGGDTSPNYTFNYISLENVDSGVLTGYSEQFFCNAPSRARRKLKRGDVLVSTVRPNLKSHFHFVLDDPHWVCSTGFSVIRCKEGVTHSGYVFFHLFGGSILRQIDTLLAGSNYPAINSRDIRALEIPLPQYEEQTAIAIVLSDMDAEITALEARRDKTRDIKQGMMQELLTGRIRLV